VAISGTTISAVGNFTELRAASPDARVVGGRDALVTPGYVNAHQHLTGDRLVHSCIPDAIDSQEAIFDWAVPIHAAHTADDDELSATLAALGALTNGITCTVEAGTVAHPDRVAAAVERIGIRARIGQWGWDVEGAPFAAPAKEVLERQRAWIESRPRSTIVEPGVTLVGHDLMSDELAGGASDLARELGVGLTFHMSPSRNDAASYLERTGRRPLVHLDWIGALGEHVIIAHGVHLDDEELEIVLRTGTAIASCPWAYLRLAQGFVNGARHDDLLRRGGRIALGCDAENAGDAVDILRAAALFVGLARDRAEDAFSFTARDALALATIAGAEAIGKGRELGSLEPGKQADIVVHGTDGPQFLPRGTDPTRQLLWASDGRSVTDVIVAGREVIRDRTCLTVDVDALRDEARQRRDFFLAHRGDGGPGH
jgi:5-methylthioadenosine/S-adenosylhomocysteine deaminase